MVCMWKKYGVCLSYVDSGMTFSSESFETSFEAGEFLYEQLQRLGANVQGDLLYREKYGAEPFALDYDLKLVNGVFFWTLEGIYRNEGEI